MKFYIFVSSYIFNNSNVKDGHFSYSSGSVDGSYSVAKVVYRDKYSNYDQQVEIVEDSYLINIYGISTKEILGFGITSRDQARRIGEWLLATNRFENQTVTFTTDLQGLMLKPSDVIQIEDQYKNNFVLQEFLPEAITGTRFYSPQKNAREEEIRKFLKDRWKDIYSY